MARILVIDDEELTRGVVRVMLARAGHEVVEAVDGVAGIEAYRRDATDMVLVDMFMPALDGIEVLRRLRAEFPDIKIGFMTGGGQREDADVIKLAEEAGADVILRKPFSSGELTAAVTGLLGAA